MLHERFLPTIFFATIVARKVVSCNRPDTQITASFSNIHKKNFKELSKLIWNLKQKNIEYSIGWRILKRAKSYSNVRSSSSSIAVVVVDLFNLSVGLFRFELQ